MATVIARTAEVVQPVTPKLIHRTPAPVPPISTRKPSPLWPRTVVIAALLLGCVGVAFAISLHAGPSACARIGSKIDIAGQCWGR